MSGRAAEPLARYRSLHLDPVNLRLHLVGVPAIVWSLLVLLAAVPLPGAGSPAPVLVVTVGAWYLWLSPGLGAVAALALAALAALALPVAVAPGGLTLAGGVFVAGWVAQFIGHARFERARPAFLTDLRQLFVAPLFVVAELLFLAGWNRDFDAALRDRAVALRAEFEAARAAAAQAK